MAEFTLTERPNPETIMRVARHKEILDDDYNPRDQLEAFARAVDEECGVTIKYKQRITDQEGNGFGRAYPTSYRMSAIYQWNKVRATLYADMEDDIDIVNCQPCILKGYCDMLKENGKMDEDDYMSLTELVDDRDKIIGEFMISEDAIDRWNRDMKDNQTKKGMIKNLIVMISFGSNLKMWADKWRLNKDEYKVSRWFKMYEMESVAIAKMVVDSHPKKHLAVDAFKKNIIKKASFKGKKVKEDEIEINHKKVLSYILQDKEFEIVMSAIQKLQDKGFDVRSYIYDGFQVAKDERLTDAVLDSIGCPDFHCRFIKKPFSEPLDLNEELLLPEPPDYFRPTLLNALGSGEEGEVTTKEQLKDQIRYFESYFAYIEGENKLIEINSDKIYYQSANCSKTRFPNCFYSYWKENQKTGKKTIDHGNLYEWWTRQPNRRSYRSVEMRPPPLYTPANVLNLWDGWPIEKIPLDESVDYSPILTLIDSVCGHCPDSVNYLLNWFAHKVQYPGKKTMVALIFFTVPQGVGKTMVSEDILKSFLLDKADDFVASHTKLEPIVGKFSVAGGKLLNVLNEANLADTAKGADELKSFITDKTFFREEKGIQGEMMANISELIATTNNANAFKVSEHDRRFQIFEPDTSVANDKVFFDPIVKALNNVAVMRKFFQFLKERDISTFAPSQDRVVTKIYKNMMGASLHNIQEFFMDFCEQDFATEHEEMRFDEVYQHYKTYCDREGKHNKIVPSKRFTMDMKKLVDGVEQKRKRVHDGSNNKASYYIFDWDVVREWADEKHSLSE